MTDFLFLGSKITVDDDCSLEIRRQLVLGRKTMTNLDSVLKSKDTTLLTNVHRVKATVFSLVKDGCEKARGKVKVKAVKETRQLRCTCLNKEKNFFKNGGIIPLTTHSITAKVKMGFGKEL